MKLYVRLRMGVASPDILATENQPDTSGEIMRELQPEAALTTRAARMRSVLTTAFEPQRLEIEDESAKHAGHSGAHAAGATHFRIEIVSDLFTSRSRVERSRMVHAALASEFASGLHALSLSLNSPAELKS